MKITIVKYPVKTTFHIKEKKLPKFKFGCKTRTALARTELAKHKFDNHAPGDFIVEEIEKTPTGEWWYLGS